jgi:PAS domain S-box-containing protein
VGIDERKLEELGAHLRHARRVIYRIAALPEAHRAPDELARAWEQLDVAEEELRQLSDQVVASQEAAFVDRQRLASLFHFAPIAYVVTDLAGCVREANHAALRLLSIDAASIAGKPLATFVPADHRTTFRGVIRSVALEQPVRDREITFLPREGEPLPAIVSVSSWPSSEGRRELRWVIRDATEWRRLRDELQAERSRRERAEQADRAKEEFLATLSHELRTPATVASGYLYLLREGELDEEGRMRALESMERSNSAQIRLVNDIMDASRIGAGKLVIDAARLDLVGLVQGALRMLQPSAVEKGLAMDYQGDVTQAWVDGDAERLQQVVWNLLSNAIKYTRSGGRVEVRLGCARSAVRVSVADNGIGIDPTSLPHIFERFRQADPSPGSRYRGLGLGLAIARSIVELHGGQLHAESPGRNQGATFSFSLPLARESGS